MLVAATRWCALVSMAALVPLTACDLGDGVIGPVQSAALSGAAFNPTAATAAGRAGHVGVLLGNGRVLIAGGINGATRLASVELYHPASGSWSAAPSMTFARHGHAAVTLADGRALVVGGVAANACTDQPVSRSAEIYDGVAGAWSPAGSMSTGRSAPAMVLLADGRVLVAGGGNRCGTLHRSAEIYDPASGTWSRTGDLNVARQAAAVVRLGDGRVLVAGGFGAYPFASLASAELYDPATGTWSVTGSMREPRLWTSDDVAAGDALVLLPDGRAFTAGGLNRCNSFGSCNLAFHRSAEVYDPATGAWSLAGSMSASRTKHRLTLVAPGRVLVMGGQSGSAVIGSAELFDAPSSAFVSVGSLVTARFDHSATRLADGRVLIAAGQGPSGILSSAEIFAANRAPVVQISPPVTGDEGAELAFSAAGSSDPDGDALSYSWDFGDGSPAVSGMHARHTYADNGRYTVTVTVSDGKLASTASTMATVANVAPVVSHGWAGGVLLAGELFRAPGSFADPGADVWSATVAWGDGSGVESLPLEGKSFSLAHRFAAAGSYTVTVTVSDDDGGSGNVQFVVTVQTPRQALEAIVVLVDQMAQSGALREGHAYSLSAKLRAAMHQLDRGNAKTAMNQLEAFRHELNALVRAGHVSAQDAQALLDAVARVTRAVQAG